MQGLQGMQDFLVLIGQIFVISCIHSIMEVFVNTDKNKYMGYILNAACYVGSLYLLIDFIFNNILQELVGIVSFPF